MGENEDNTEETDLSQRSAEDLAWLKEAVEAGAAGADVDVKGILLDIAWKVHYGRAKMGNFPIDKMVKLPIQVPTRLY